MRCPTIALLSIMLSSVALAQGTASPEQPDRSWIERSNSYTSQLLDVELQHRPERGSREGLAKFDTLISKPTLADEMARATRAGEGAGRHRRCALRGVGQEGAGGSGDPAQGVRPAVSAGGLRAAARGALSSTPARRFFRGCACCSMIRSPRSAVRPQSHGCANIRDWRAATSRSLRCSSNASSSRSPSRACFIPRRVKWRPSSGAIPTTSTASVRCSPSMA